MTYVGQQPTTGDFKKLDSITTSSATTFNLRQGGVAVYPQSANHCIVSLNGVIQAPVDAFTIVNDTIVFASSLASSDVIDFILVLGNVNDIGTVSDDTVSTAKLQANSVTAAKLNTALLTGHTDIGGDLADADLILVDDGAGGTLRKSAMSRIKTYVGSGLEHADQWRLTGGITGSHAQITGTWERVDTYNFPTDPLGSGVSESSGVFTFPDTGIWYVTFDATCYCSSDGAGAIQIFNTDGQNMAQQYVGFVGNTDEDNTGHVAILIQVDSTGADKVRVLTTTTLGSNFNVRGDTNTNYTYVTFIKLSSSTS